MSNIQRPLQVGVAEEEVEVALPDTIGVVGVAEPVVEIMELVRSTELLVEDMVAFVELDELYEAAAEPMKATAIVMNVFFIVLMS